MPGADLSWQQQRYRHCMMSEGAEIPLVLQIIRELRTELGGRVCVLAVPYFLKDPYAGLDAPLYALLATCFADLPGALGRFW